MVRLSEAEYLATLVGPMQRVALDEQPPFDFWPYFDAIPAGDFEGHDCSAGAVSYAWRDATGHFEHVLINSEDRNVFMVLVLNLHAGRVLGHRLLDLPRLYGLSL